MREFNNQMQIVNTNQINNHKKYKKIMKVEVVKLSDSVL